MKKSILICGGLLFLGIHGLFAQIGMKKQAGGFMILDGEKNVAFYQKDEISINSEQGRNNFWHPVFLPDGTEITENAPEDHLHHRGIFWAWHQILIGDQPVGDPWELKNFSIDVKDVEYKRINDGDGSFRTTAFWKSPLYENGAKAYLKEDCQYTFFVQNGNYRIIRFDLALTALVDELKLGGSDDEKGYGGFSVRMKLPDDVKFSGEGGNIEPQNTAVDAGRYVNISGSMAKSGNHGGMLIYASPENQQDRQTWILRKKNSMQNAVFPGRDPVELKRGVPLKLSYTLVLYTGKINEKRVIKNITKAAR
ncbi:DUF6807 family protein [Gaoshiqia sediminis]|uniref:PmoA family protein n=1 Tax=Gaoshiqia sediminis TaxID=2986998 RepID=A0AA42C7M1_9BACT|nr:DUF6807 family protein [Gaoshiqia sediminis]MCW0481726.1 PmoA family protein [Gaoshiqia sediminis]